MLSVGVQERKQNPRWVTQEREFNPGLSYKRCWKSCKGKLGRVRTQSIATAGSLYLPWAGETAGETGAYEHSRTVGAGSVRKVAQWEFRPQRRFIFGTDGTQSRLSAKYSGFPFLLTFTSSASAFHWSNFSRSQLARKVGKWSLHRSSLSPPPTPTQSSAGKGSRGVGAPTG